MREFFPFPELRAGQGELLDKLEESWNDYDVIVIRAPVGFGKSPIAAAIQSWELSRKNGCCIITQNNLLRSQYLDTFPNMITVKSQDEYWLPKYKMTEREFRQRIYKWGPKGGQYNIDYRAVRRKGSAVVGNFYTYLAHKLQRNTLIVDEAHGLLPTLQELAARKIWQHEFNYPRNATSLQDLLDWLDDMTADMEEIPLKVKRLRSAIKSSNPATLLRFDTETFRGDRSHCLKLIPLNVTDIPSPFWNNKVEKVVLMSATIGASDIARMGLANRRVLYIDVESPIPVERRPILFQPVGNMSYASQDKNMQALADDLIALADHHDGKGFVHAPYSLANKLRKLLAHDNRFIFHSKDNKRKKYEDFYAMPAETRAVMVGSGMHEGLDLKYDVAEWQALTKVPYPSLADPAMRHLAETDPDYYNWYVSKDVMQASGRICRSPDDEGVTYLLDSQFKVWYDKSRSGLPKWFTDAIDDM